MDIYGAGEKARIVWALTALLMFLLTIGQTILMKPDVIANRLGLVNVNVAVCVWGFLAGFLENCFFAAEW